MAWTLKRESIEIVPDFNILVTEFENQTRQTRLVTPEMKITWKIKTPNLTKAQLDNYVDDFMNNFGSLTSFQFACPFTDTTYDVAYKQGSFRANFQGGFYSAQFEFERVF